MGEGKSIIIDATYCYWGSPDGPSPHGSGDAVNEYVDCIPYLMTPVIIGGGDP